MPGDLPNPKTSSAGASAPTERRVGPVTHAVAAIVGAGAAAGAVSAGWAIGELFITDPGPALWTAALTISMATTVTVAVRAARLAWDRDRMRGRAADWRRRAEFDATTALPSRVSLSAALERTGPATLILIEATTADGEPVDDRLWARLGARGGAALESGDHLFALERGRFALLAPLRRGAPAWRRLDVVVSALGRPCREEAGGLEGAPAIRTRMGVVAAPKHGRGVARLLERAELALAAAARAGVQLRAFRRSMAAARTETSRRDEIVARAIQTADLETLFEPTADLQSGAILDWRVTPRVIEAPGALREVFDAAARMGVSAALLDLLMTRAAALAAELPAGQRVCLPTPLSLLGVVGGGAAVLAAGARANLDPARLDIEFEDGPIATGSPVAARAVVAGMAALRAAGARITLVVEGDGALALDPLARASVDRLVLGPRLIADLEETSAARALVDGLTRLAQSLEITVAAAGVTRETQVAFLQRRRCGAARGAWVGAPLDLAAASAMAQGPLEIRGAA